MANQTFFTIDQTVIANLKTAWQNRQRKYCSDKTKIDQIFEFLVEKYSETHRAYHNLGHINYLLGEAETIEFEDFDSVYFAIWFHDVIYEPKKSDNEIESAKLAVKLLQDLNLTQLIITKVEQIILATQKHSAENLAADGKIFLDLDLSILGATPVIYQQYSQAIREEYSYVLEILYRQGRKQVLENFLKREVIYFSENLRERFENQARVNLANEIKELS